MNMKKKAVLLSFVGATVLALGVPSQQTFASTYVNKANNSRSYKSSYKHARGYLQIKGNKFNWCENIITKPVPVPEIKPEVKPVPAPETKPEVKPVPVPETKPEVKPVPVPETKPEVKPVPETKPEVNSSINSFETRVVELTNAERAKQGLPALKIDTELSKVARLKSQDIQSKGYFDHTSPTYGSPFDMMKQFGISYRSAGENIAKGQRTPEQVVTAWMNSEGHRKNILGNFTHIGVGYIESGSVWTQMFISK